MKEVTKEEFFAFIGPLDVLVASVGDWPYTSTFTLRHSRKLMGEIRQCYTDGIDHKYPIVSNYFINQ